MPKKMSRRLHQNVKAFEVKRQGIFFKDLDVFKKHFLPLLHSSS